MREINTEQNRGPRLSHRVQTTNAGQNCIGRWLAVAAWLTGVRNPPRHLLIPNTYATESCAICPRLGHKGVVLCYLSTQKALFSHPSIHLPLLNSQVAMAVMNNGNDTGGVQGEVNGQLLANLGVVDNLGLGVGARDEVVGVAGLDVVDDLGLGDEGGRDGVEVGAGRIGAAEADEPVA